MVEGPFVVFEGDCFDLFAVFIVVFDWEVGHEKIQNSKIIMMGAVIKSLKIIIF